MGGQLPYRPVIEALRPRIERENAPDDLLSDTWLAELLHLLPTLGDRYPDLLASVGETSVWQAAEASSDSVLLAETRRARSHHSFNYTSMIIFYSFLLL